METLVYILLGTVLGLAVVLVGQVSDVLELKKRNLLHEKLIQDIIRDSPALARSMKNRGWKLPEDNP